MIIKKIAKTAQDWLPFEKILDDGIIISNNRYLKILKVFPINYDLKSELEKESILNSYKLFFKSCNFDIQILIQSKKEDLSLFISQIKRIQNTMNDRLNKIANSYIEYVINNNIVQNSSSKNFFILISSQFEKNLDDINIKSAREDLNSKYSKIKDSLSRCGNLVFDVNNRGDVKKLLYSFYNFRKDLRLNSISWR